MWQLKGSSARLNMADISDKWQDKDGNWKFTVAFVTENASVEHTYLYKTEVEVDAAIAKITPKKDTLVEAAIADEKLENNADKT